VGALATLLFLAAGACFIFGLKLLGKTKTARKGNMVSALGMGLAITGTCVKIVQSVQNTGGSAGIEHFSWIIGGIIVGAIVGIPAAKLVKMTSMPEMVALFNGFGGIASLLIGWSELHSKIVADGGVQPWVEQAGNLPAATIFLAMLIGGVTFTGSDEQKAKQQEAMASYCAAADIVITTAALFGRKAPIVIKKEVVERMKPGSVIVDYAVASGGNVEGSRPGEEVIVNGVRIIGLANYPGQIAVDASRMYANNLYNMIDEFWDDEKKNFNLDRKDEIIQGCLITHAGELVNEMIRNTYAKEEGAA